ncbi:hypothetical protein CISEMA079M_15400 [Citrobacter sedlakii]
MYAVGLRGQQYRPDPICIDHCTGDGVAVAVFDLNCRARMAGPAEGRRVIVGRGIGGQTALFVALIIGDHVGWRIFGVINGFSFGHCDCFRFTAVIISQQRANRAAAQRGTSQPCPRKIILFAGGFRHQRFDAVDRRRMRRQLNRVQAGNIAHIVKGHVGQSRFIIENQFRVQFRLGIFGEIAAATNHAAVFHVDQQVVALADVAGHILSGTEDFDHGSAGYCDGKVAFARQDGFFRGVTIDNVCGF